MDKCPTCERNFKHINNYPLVYIKSFERLELPELIAGGIGEIYTETKTEGSGNKPLPEEVLELFQQTGKDRVVHEGNVYTKLGNKRYDCEIDVTDMVKEIISREEVQTALSTLESLVGQELEPKQVLKHPECEELVYDEHHSFKLSFMEGEKSDGYRTSKVGVSGGQILVHGRTLYSISQRIAVIKYEGSLRE